MKIDTYSEMYFLAPDKAKIMEQILLSILLEIKDTLVKSGINNFKEHGNVLIFYQSQWFKLVERINTKEKRPVLRNDGLLKALMKMFPNEMEEIAKENQGISKYLDFYGLYDSATEKTESGL